MTQWERSYLRKRRAEEAVIHAYSKLILLIGGLSLLCLAILKLGI